MATPTVSVYKTGSIIEVQRAKYSGTSKGGPGGIRNNISKFSRASRRRLLRKVARLDRNVLPLFLTMTYPSSYPDDPTEWKRHLNDVWAKRLKRKHPQAGYIWRLEFQKRGAPHFHLLVYGVDSEIEIFRRWLSESWYDVVASDDEKHLRAGTNARQTRSAHGAMVYLAKEIAKTKQADISDTFPDGVGRWWGVKFKDKLPWSEVEHISISDQDADRLIRLMRRHARLKSREYHKLSVFCDGALWSNRLEEILNLPIWREPPKRPLRRLAEVEERLALKMTRWRR